MWALKTGTQLTHAEIGQTLEMSTVQVSHVLRRLPKKEEPFRTWIETWRSA